MCGGRGLSRAIGQQRRGDDGDGHPAGLRSALRHGHTALATLLAPGSDTLDRVSTDGVADLHTEAVDARSGRDGRMSERIAVAVRDRSRAEEMAMLRASALSGTTIPPASWNDARYCS